MVDNQIIDETVGKGVLFLDQKDKNQVNAIAMQFDVVNRNRRLYTADAVKNGLNRMNLPAYAKDGHPGQNNGTDTLGRRVVKWTDAQIVDGIEGNPPTVHLKGTLTKTQGRQ